MQHHTGVLYVYDDPGPLIPGKQFIERGRICRYEGESFAAVETHTHILKSLGITKNRN